MLKYLNISLLLSDFFYLFQDIIARIQYYNSLTNFLHKYHMYEKKMNAFRDV